MRDIAYIFFLEATIDIEFLLADCLICAALDEYMLRPALAADTALCLGSY